MRILKRRRTWRTLLAFPLGLTLGWLAAGMMSHASLRSPPEDEPPAAAPRNVEHRHDGKADEASPSDAERAETLMEQE